jgi:steroid delta-isomerase-like uncharacterized protein
MTLKSNKIIANRFYEIFNSGNLDQLYEIVATDFIDRSSLPGQVEGIAWLIQTMSTFRLGFPDIYYTVHETIAAGDKVILRVTGFGKHTGNYMGIPPTGKEISFHEIDIFQIAKGKITEAWHVEDMRTAMEEIFSQRRPG